MLLAEPQALTGGHSSNLLGGVRSHVGIVLALPDVKLVDCGAHLLCSLHYHRSIQKPRIPTHLCVSALTISQFRKGTLLLQAHVHMFANSPTAEATFQPRATIPR